MKSYKQIDALFIEREELISLKDIVEVSNILKEHMPIKFNNLDIYQLEGGCSIAYCLISESLAEELKYDYSILNKEIISLMNDVNKENESWIYDFIYNGKRYAYAFFRDIEGFKHRATSRPERYIYPFFQDVEEFKQRITLKPEEFIIAENREGKAYKLTFEDMLEEIKYSAECSEEDYFDFLEMQELEDNRHNYRKYVRQILDFCVSSLNTDGRCEHSRVEYYLVNDSYIQVKWNELKDATFNENGTNLVLSDNWFIFEKGTEKEYILNWFDSYYSKGIDALKNVYQAY